MSIYNSLCPQSTVYVPRVQFLYPENSLCPQSAVYVQYIYVPEYSFCPQTPVSLPRVQFMPS